MLQVCEELLIKRLRPLFCRGCARGLRGPRAQGPRGRHRRPRGVRDLQRACTLVELQAVGQNHHRDGRGECRVHGYGGGRGDHRGDCNKRDAGTERALDFFIFHDGLSAWWEVLAQAYTKAPGRSAAYTQTKARATRHDCRRLPGDVPRPGLARLRGPQGCRPRLLLVHLRVHRR